MRVLIIVALALLLAGCARPALTIVGSDTMVDLVALWAEDYARGRPGARLAVSGGGSGTGVAALLQGRSDVAAISRPLSDRERAEARRRGIELREYPVAIDALVVIVHLENPLEAITYEQLRALYTSGVADWALLGGAGGRPVPITRESSSGSHAFFREEVLGGAELGRGVLMLPSHQAVLEVVRRDRGAIGYVSAGFVDGTVKPLAVARTSREAPVYPTEAAIRSGAYPLTRPVYLVTAGRPEAEEFLRYVITAGQALTRRAGLFPAR